MLGHPTGMESRRIHERIMRLSETAAHNCYLSSCLAITIRWIWFVPS